MDSHKPKIIAIVGPTASGKSDFAVFLARKFKGEIVSADSRQVYRGMDLGSGKITKKEMCGVKHYLLDVASPKTANFNVNKFKTLAEKEIKKILKSGHLPIIVGGTGFWIDALVFNKSLPDVAPNQKLRDYLNKLSTEKLFSMLKKKDPARAKSIDPQNKRRLVRALEIIKAIKKVPQQTAQQNYQPLFIGLDMDPEKLRQRILKRLDKRLKQGMIKEVRHLHKQGVSWKTLENFGLEYRFVAQFLQGKINKEQMHQLLVFATRKYAKRQRTWFKLNKEIHWFDPTKKTTAKKAAALIKNFLAIS